MVTIRDFQNRIVVNSMKVVKATAILLSSIFFIDSIPANESDFLRAEISNGLITAKIYLPDANNGYYRSTRFDWLGAIYSLPGKMVQ